MEAVMAKAVVAVAMGPPPAMSMESAVRPTTPPAVEASAPAPPPTPAPGFADGSPPEEHDQDKRQARAMRLHGPSDACASTAIHARSRRPVV
jgi:hypothetical protein